MDGGHAARNLRHHRLPPVGPSKATGWFLPACSSACCPLSPPAPPPVPSACSDASGCPHTDPTCCTHWLRGLLEFLVRSLCGQLASWVSGLTGVSAQRWCAASSCPLPKGRWRCLWCLQTTDRHG